MPQQKRAEIDLATGRVHDEWKEKMRIAVSSHQAEMEKELETSRALRRRVAEEEDKVRAANRQVAVVREEMQIVAEQEKEGLKGQINELEGKLRAQTLEMSRLKEDYTSMAGRAASALQQAQVNGVINVAVISSHVFYCNERKRRPQKRKWNL